MSSRGKIKLPAPTAEELHTKVTCMGTDSSGKCMRTCKDKCKGKKKTPGEEDQITESTNTTKKVITDTGENTAVVYIERFKRDNQDTDSTPVKAKDKKTDVTFVTVKDEKTEPTPLETKDQETDPTPVQTKDQKTDPTPVQKKDQKTDSTPVQKKDQKTDPNQVKSVKSKDQITQTEVPSKEDPSNKQTEEKPTFQDKLKRWSHLDKIKHCLLLDKKNPKITTIDKRSMSTVKQKELIILEADTKKAELTKKMVLSEKKTLEDLRKLHEKQAVLDKKLNKAEMELVQARMKEKITKLEEPQPISPVQSVS